MTGQKTDKPAHVTTYEVSLYWQFDDPREEGKVSAWRPQGTIQTTHGAPAAIKAWAEQQGEKFTGGTLRAIPTSRITERDVTVETRRQLTLGAP